jgi:hypothetical protein
MDGTRINSPKQDHLDWQLQALQGHYLQNQRRRRGTRKGKGEQRMTRWKSSRILPRERHLRNVSTKLDGHARTGH